MPEQSFTVPTLWQDEVLREYARLNETHLGRARIVEVYGAHASNPFGSGRAALVLPRVSDADVAGHVALARQLGLGFNYLLNAACLGGREGTFEGQRELRELLAFLVDIGVEHVTATSPMLIELIRRYQPGLRVGASVICYVDSVERLRFFRALGVSRITVDIDMTRNFPLIRALRRACDAQLGILVNSLCRIDCPLKTYHYNVNAHFSQTGELVDKAGRTLVEASNPGYIAGRCMLQNHRDKVAVMKTAWIRPEDLHHYTEAGIDILKIQGRGARPEDMLRTVSMYMEGAAPLRHLPLSYFGAGRYRYSLDVEALDGFLDHFLDRPYLCRLGCDSCHHCDGYAERAVRDDAGAEGGETIRGAAESMVERSLVFGEAIERLTEKMLAGHGDPGRDP